MEELYDPDFGYNYTSGFDANNNYVDKSGGTGNKIFDYVRQGTNAVTPFLGLFGGKKDEPKPKKSTVNPLYVGIGVIVMAVVLVLALRRP